MADIERDEAYVRWLLAREQAEVKRLQAENERLRAKDHLRREKLDELAAQIMRQDGELERERGGRRIVDEALRDALAEAERLRVALEWLADPANASCGEGERYDVARHALGGRA